MASGRDERLARAVGPWDFPGLREPTGRGLKRLRVLHIDSGRKWRGGQRQVLLLAAGLMRRGHEPLIIAPPDSPLLRRAALAGLDAEPTPMQAEDRKSTRLNSSHSQIS